MNKIDFNSMQANKKYSLAAFYSLTLALLKQYDYINFITKSFITTIENYIYAPCALGLIAAN